MWNDEELEMEGGESLMYLKLIGRDGREPRQSTGVVRWEIDFAHCDLPSDQDDKGAEC